MSLNDHRYISVYKKCKSAQCLKFRLAFNLLTRIAIYGEITEKQVVFFDGVAKSFYQDGRVHWSVAIYSNLVLAKKYKMQRFDK